MGNDHGNDHGNEGNRRAGRRGDRAAPGVAVTGVIRLGQFLKLSGLAEDGAQARGMVRDGDVSVNGDVELRRGRQLAAGDLVEADTAQGRLSARVTPA